MGTSSFKSNALLLFKLPGEPVLSVLLAFRLWEPQGQKVATAILMSPAVLLQMPATDPVLGLDLLGIPTTWSLGGVSRETMGGFGPGN